MNLNVQIESWPGSPDRPNEDWAAAADDVVVVLDGAGIPKELPTGCSHSVEWFVENLGPALIRHAANRGNSLPTALELAIIDTRKLHDHQCDLSNPNSPSATVVLLRLNAGMVEALVLADSTLVVGFRSGEVATLSDDRLQRLKARLAAEGHPPSPGGAMSEYRNRPDGFWVAGAIPEAAVHSLTDSWPSATVSAAALLTDGAARKVDMFSAATWPDVIQELAHRGPSWVLRRVREIENSDPQGTRWRRSKIHDDATIASVQLADSSATNDRGATSGHYHGAMTQPARLDPRPEFTSPPVVEVVIGVEFVPLTGLDTVRIVRMHDLWREDYPVVSVQPAMAPAAQPSGVVAGTGLQIGFGPGQIRLWMASTDERMLLQLQNDRLVLNWRRRGAESYPSYDALIPEFKRRWEQFAESTRDLAPLQPFVAEMSYVNSISAPVRGSLERVCSVVSPHPGPGPLVASHAQFVTEVEGSDGHTVSSFAQAADNLVNLTVSTRIALPLGVDVPDTEIFATLDRAHEASVVSFTLITGDDMQKQWGRTR